MVSITFHDGAGGADKLLLQYVAGQPVKLPECPFDGPEGRTFLGWGWFPGGVSIGDTLLAEHDLELYALWEGLQLTDTPPATGDVERVVLWHLLWLCAAAGIVLLNNAKRQKTE
jgi:hypothetical protein